MPPFAAATPGEAERRFRTACAEPGSDFARYPGDFSLYQVGVFDTSSGGLQAMVPPVFVCQAVVDQVVEDVRRLRHGS